MQNKVLMVKFVINCTLNIQTQFKYAHQQILFFTFPLNVKLVYSIQVLGPWLWGNRPFFSSRNFNLSFELLAIFISNIACIAG
jgi:hypothetical protein